VTKSMPDGFLEKTSDGVTNAHESKPDEYKDVATADFLDPEHFKYPVDQKHLMPVLRYFNQSGQREAGGYDEAAWAAMGKKLAAKLSSATGETYGYDQTTETVTKQATKKTEDVKGVNQMNNSNLVSKHVNQDVKNMLAQFGKTIDEPQADQAPAATVTPETPATPEAPVAETPVAEQPAAETPTVEGDVAKSTSIIESLLSDIASSLSTLTSGKSSSSTSSDSSTGSDSSTSTPASNSSTTSTDKAAPSTSASSDDDDMESSLSSMGKAIETMRQLLAKRKSSTSFTPTSASTSTTSTPTSTSSTSFPSSTGSTSTDTSSTTSKALEDLTSTIVDIKKAVDELKARPAALPQRKGIAVAMEKKFESGDDQVFIEDPAIVAKLQKDTRADFKDLHAYRATGTLPAWFQHAA